MSKVNITLTIDDEKQKALEVFLQKEGTTVQKKMDEALRQLYEQTVPEPVREYLDARTAPTRPKRPPKPKAPAPTATQGEEAGV